LFRRRADIPEDNQATSSERISSVIADGVSLRGKLTGSGGIRIEGSFDGEIDLDGLLVIGPSGRVSCKELRAKNVIVAGAMRGNIVADRVEIRSSGRVWGDVITTAMSTQEGAFLRGQIRMEDDLEPVLEDSPGETAANGNIESPETRPNAKKTAKKKTSKTKK
jgi:cytoskeletal protein CcmA (bactofilin family)